MFLIDMFASDCISSVFAFHF